MVNHAHRNEGKKLAKTMLSSLSVQAKVGCLEGGVQMCAST